MNIFNIISFVCGAILMVASLFTKDIFWMVTGGFIVVMNLLKAILDKC